MTFNKITLEEIKLFKTYLREINLGTCDYSVGGIFMWRDYFSMEYAVENGALFTRLYNKEREVFYNIPMGIDLPEGVALLKRAMGVDKIKFCTIPERALSSFYNAFSGVKIEEQEDYADYLYSANDLCFLKGRKFSGQRNMINQFLRENSEWIYEEITEENVKQVEDFLLRKYKISDIATDIEIEEESKTL